MTEIVRDTAKKRFFFVSAFVAWMLSLVVAFLQLTFVVPRIFLLYTDSTLPLLTSLTVQLSNACIGYPIHICVLLLFMSMVFGFCTALVHKKTSKIVQVVYCMLLFFFGSVLNLFLFCSLYFPIFSL